jgi:predicted dehydrogenase
VPSSKVALAGFGRWGRLIFRDLRSLGAEVAVVAHSEEARREAAAAGATAVAASVEALPPVDGAVVATPTSTHAEVTERLLDAIDGPIFVEKPVTCDVDDARRILRRGGERVFVMEKWRYHPGVEAIRDLVAEGSVGRVLGMRSLRHQWGLQHRDVDAAWILLPHDLSIAREILGTVPPLRAAAGVAHGREAALAAILGSDPWLVVDASTLGTEHRRELHIVCEDAVMVLPDSYSDHVEMRRPGRSDVEKLSVSTELPLGRELRAFVSHLAGGPPPKSSAAEGAEVVERIAEIRGMAGMDRSAG